MMEARNPLKYRISSWRQLPECLSNNSNHLHIKITDYIQDNRLYGLKITIEHELFGVVFAYIVDARGSLISSNGGGKVHELSVSGILNELARFGFLIEYVRPPQLPPEQVEFLTTINKLQYDKLRVLSVWSIDDLGRKKFDRYIVAFNVGSHSQWLNASYSPDVVEYTNAIIAGTAYNISGLSDCRKFSWEWLENKVINICDILSDIGEEVSSS